MKDIIIVCAGVYAIEIYYEILSINKKSIEQGESPKYNIVGFLSDVPDALDGKDVDARIIGDIQSWTPRNDEVYAMGISSPENKKQLSHLLISRGASFETIISVDARISDDLRIGKGCFVSSSIIGCDVEIGDFVNINSSLICGGSRIGSYTTTTGFSVVENTSIGNCVFVGSQAVIKEGCIVGDGAKIGAGSIVVENVPSNITVFGNPAKRIK